MKFMITNKSSGPAMNCSSESGRNEEGKVTRSHKGTWAAPSTKETSADLVIFTPRAFLFTKRTIPTYEKKWTRYGGDLAVSVSKLATTMLRHYDQDEPQRDGSRHWDSMKPVDESVGTQRSSRL